MPTGVLGVAQPGMLQAEAYAEEESAADLSDKGENSKI